MNKILCWMFGHKMAMTGSHPGTSEHFGGFIVSCLRCGEMDEATKAYLKLIRNDRPLIDLRAMGWET